LDKSCDYLEIRKSLSVPGMRGWVERPAEVKLSGWDEFGEEKDWLQE
jgi:peptide deformylase